MRTDYDFSGRRYVITGPSPHSAIGQAIAQRLAASGASVILLARHEEGLNETLKTMQHPQRHVIAPFDLNDLEGTPAFIKQLAERHGQINGLVHSASQQGFHPLRTVTAADYEKVFRINVGASLMLAKGLRQKDVAAKPASLIYIVSAAGLRGIKGRVLYASSKATQVALARTLGIELAGEKIRVNCVAPGIMKGLLTSHMMERLSEEQNAQLLAQHPLGYGEGSDVASAVAFLLSDDAHMITGTVMPVDGGYSAQ